MWGDQMKRVSKINLKKLMDMSNIEKNLIVSSLYLSAFEIIKISIIEDTKNFFSEVKGKELVLNKQEYKKEVLKLDKDFGKKRDQHIELNASCLWLEKMNVITKDEIDEIHLIRKHRNEIAHELPRILIDSTLDVNIKYLMKIRELVNKIDNWWINVEMSIQYLDLDNVEEVKTGRIMILDHILSILD